MSASRGRFFDRIDWLAFWVTGGCAFLVYLCSIAPSVGLEDAGELATAANGLGVPHPPGYPLWTMLSWVFCRVFSWVTWQGFPNPAWAISLCSAVTGAVACALTALLITRSSRDLLKTLGGEDETGTACAGWIGGVAGALAFAFSPGMWSQAVIVEVYALGAFFLALTMVLAYRWMCERKPQILVWLGLVFGLGLTNYQVLLLAALPIGLLVCARRWRLAQSFLAVAIPVGLTIYLLMLGTMASADALSTPGAPVILRPPEASANPLPGCLAPAWVYLALGGCLTAFAGALCWERVARWAWVPFVGAVGVLLFSWVHDAPKTLPPGFTGTLYAFSHAWGVHVVALGGLWALCWKYRRARRFALAVSGVQLAGLCLLQQGLLLGLTHPTLGWFWWPVAWLALLLFLARRLLVQGRWVAWTVLATALGLLVYVYMPIVSDALNPAMNWGYARTWEGFKHAISRGQYEAITPSALFSMQYLKQVAGYLGDLRMQFSLPVVGIAFLGVVVLGWKALRARAKMAGMWLGFVVLLFGVMSVVLVALANPTGDLQDSFIQKVKFISSHGIFVLGLGYALAGALVWLRGRATRGVWRAGCAVALVVALVPVGENFFNGELIRAAGSAEQTGHDFGWQFGAYMLEGARQINQEVEEDEEPLPDPFWPPPMEQGSIFFGGTDPGRFVPTYMVHAIGFRPDLYVLTQNALADPTYMNVERDLYGSQLWMPTADEVRKAFTDYADAVQAGVRQTQGQVREVNGRVQITGSSAVMDICADLAKQIFERNPEHSFYLEESYRIPWMDTYLEPAGLAMRLCRDERNLRGIRERDLEFWDWMMRRLVERPAFRRDFAAQKSFSKLRSSIAGIYARGGETQAAEQAFLQARVLYPLSPEVLFRYMQESLLPAYRFTLSQRLLRNYLTDDPKNARAKRMAERIDVLSAAYAEFTALTARIREKQATTADVCALAEVCEALGMVKGAKEYWRQVAEAPDLTAQEARDGCLALQRLNDSKTAMALLLRVPKNVWGTFSERDLILCSALAQTHAEPELALELLQVAVEKAPQSGLVWLNIGLYYYSMGEGARAYDAMRQAVQFGAAPLIQSDSTVATIFMQLMNRYAPTKGARL